MAPDGRMFLADSGNNKVKMIDKQGLMHTIAGGGTVPVNSDGVAALQAQLSTPVSIGVTHDGVVYFVNLGSDQVLRMTQGSDGSWTVMPFFGARQTTDCGTSRISGVAASSSVNSALTSSLSIMCQGIPRSVTISDTCPAAGGDTRIAISQGVDSYSNIVEIVKPCGT